MRFILAFCLTVLAMVPAHADDRDYLTALIEDNLSSAGRTVTITGFVGALSSQAHLDSLTIADETGVWISLTDVTLDWTRSDLLSGKLTVNSLTAAEIRLARLPPSQTNAEASSFALPSLPLAVNIGSVIAEKVVLDAPVLGVPITARVAANLSLADGAGAGALDITRIGEGPQGSAQLTVDYRNADRNLALDMNITEQAGGILARLLGIPDAPQLQLTAKGSGPLSAFAARIDLSSGGVSRLAGDVHLTGQGAGATRFGANLSGDMAPLFVPEYRDFFGKQVAVMLDGVAGQDSLSITALDISAAALHLQGSLDFAAGLPQRFDLQGQIADPKGGQVLLPLGTQTRITTAQITAGFDRAKGQDWQAQMTVTGLDHADMQIASFSLNGAGQIAGSGAARLFNAKLDMTAEGVQPRDAALSDAIGRVIWGDANLHWREGDGVVTLTALHLGGDGFGLDVAGDVAGLARGFPITGKAGLRIDDLSRIARLIGHPVQGSATVNVAGQGALLTGGFDLKGQIAGQDLALGIAQLDGVLRGASRINLSALRDGAGITLRQLDLTTTGVQAQARGTAAKGITHLQANLNAADLGVMGYGGALQGQISYDGSLTDGALTLTATGTGLRIGQAQADRVIGGTSHLNAQASLRAGKARLENLELSNPHLTLAAKSAARDTAAGETDVGDLAFDLNARLANLAVILPEFPGGVTLKGRAETVSGGQNLDLTITGPAGINAQVKGLFAMDNSDIQVSGTTEAGLINAYITPRSLSGNADFALRLRGPALLSSLTGKVTLANGKLADPSLPFALQQMQLGAVLANGRADVQGTATASGGGQGNLAGTVGLTAPFDGDVTISFSSIKMRNPDLFDTSLSGDLQIKGPLLAGAMVSGVIDLGRTEIQVPSRSFSTASRLTGLHHTGDSAAVRATRSHAFGDTDSHATPVSYGLDLRVRAPNRVFVRGRGLTAELGGEIALGGTTQDVRPSGSFNLIQGRFEFLGKRLTLDEVLLQMEGQLVPTIRIRAVTENDDVTTTVTIEGPAIDPEISLTSAPELPQEEVLAQLLFGQNLRNLSAIQGVQLANAVATLAGKGGDGIIGRMRKALALDDLDLQTDKTGATTLKMGKYLSDKIYTDLSIAPNGKSEIDLNFIINQKLSTHLGLVTDGNANAGFVIQNSY